MNGGVSSSLIAALRRDLVTSSFSVETVGELWGEDAAAALFRGQRLPAIRALHRRRRDGVALSKAETLAALFVLNVPVARAAVDAALPTLGSAGAEQLGLVGPGPASIPTAVSARAGSAAKNGGDSEGVSAIGDHNPEISSVFDPAEAAAGAAAPTDTLAALLDLRPYSFVDTLGAGSWWIVSDLGEVALGGRPLDVDHVLGVGGASTTLSGLMINEPVGRVLDLGTGCGIQALHASRHAGVVVATDISERALILARMNAELNAIDNIEFRLGSLFEPVAGERFDQIVSNPPFVITPRREGVPVYEYRDAGFVGDELVATVIRGCEEHLAPGGIAQLLGNWEYRTAAGVAVAADGLDRVRGWLQGSSLDAWVIERELQDAPQYAETWIRDGGTRPGTPEFDDLYAAWLDDFEARGVSHVGFGYVLLRNNRNQRNNRNHTAGSPLRPMRRFEALDGARGSNPTGLGQYFQTSLEGYDWQQAKSDEELLASTVTYAPDVTEERHYWPGQENPTVMTLRQGSGFARTVPLGTALAALVGACDGELTIGQICGAIAHLLEVNELELLVEVLPSVRDLLVDGFLLPV
ncbi:MAG: SAM-dependent methyltransferase [Subtercola sp.]|nr:SAM-dependent methyltransferase [Subtercola sp.]